MSLQTIFPTSRHSNFNFVRRGSSGCDATRRGTKSGMWRCQEKSSKTGNRDVIKKRLASGRIATLGFGNVGAQI